MPYPSTQNPSSTSTPRPLSLPQIPRLANAKRGLKRTLRQLDALDDDEPIEWTEEDVVRLHCLLLADLGALADPATPLEEKFDTLRWIYTEPDKDMLPFSFASCLRVAGCSPMSTYPYFGRLDADEVRALLKVRVRGWLLQTLSRYPIWVQDVVRRNPQWVADCLAKNPQWINEQLKSQSTQPDLFV